MTVIITDIDQTITNAGIDLWNEITKQIIPDKKHIEYNERLTLYKTNVSLNPIKESKDMMEYAINLFPENTSDSLFSIEIYTKTLEFVKNLINTGGIRENAVEFMIQVLENSGQVVFSSANYIEGAVAVRDALFKDKQKLRDKIKVSGSVVNWHDLRVTHINVAENKVKSLEKVLNMTKEDIKALNPLIFGDDPVINDIELFKLNKNASFLMETPKNIELEIPEYIKRTSWSEILTPV